MSTRLVFGPVVFCLLLGVCLGVGGYTFYYAHGFSYFSSSPETCINCHIMKDQYDGWQRSSHHAVAVCVDCHMPEGLISKYLVKAENGYLHSKAFTLQDFADPIQIRDSSLRVLNQACLKCHGNFVGELASQSSDSAADEPRTCTRCHNDVGH